ncbi:MAG TPA: M13 family metallopeptidase [Puia sp.]|nr:M13 family metallopeptidase [Puia sp.]
MPNQPRFAPIMLVTIFIFAGLTGCKNNAENTPADPIDISAIDSSVRPQDDFFNYANGGWIKKAVIPASQSGWGAIYSLGDQSVTDIHAIMDSLSKLTGLKKDSIEQQVADLYASIMDSAGIEAKGFSPLKEDLTRISGIKDVSGILDEVVKGYKDGNAELFAFYPNADDKNSAYVIAHFDQGGLGLPNRDYYFKQDSSVKSIKKAYEEYITKTFTLIGEADPAKEAAQVMDAETELATVSKSPVDLRDPNANYHKLSVAALDKLTPGLKWKDLLTGLGVRQDTVVVGQPGFYSGMYKALGKLPVDNWKSYLKFHLVDNYVPVLGAQIVDANFDFNRLLSGQKEKKPRWKRASQMVDNLLGEALGQLYVKRYFPPEAKQKMKELVDNLQQTYAEHIQHLDWMSDSTKQKALVKLNAFAKKIGYPDKWKDYSTVKINRDDAIGNLKSCGRYEYNRTLNTVGKRVDRAEWHMTPPTVDAYYNPTTNDINFPAGILQPPFFYKDGDDAVNYGAIGLVIGHEMTHGFDDQGRQYDGDGNLKDWWSAQDADRFKQKANLIVQQYDGYIAVDTFHINGSLTLGENIADVGGLSIAYAAFKRTAQGKDTVRIAGLTPDERFFRSFAQVWRVKTRPESMKTQVLNNPHSTAQFRVDGPVTNLNAFYDTYHVQSTDMMYRPDSLRAHIW